SDGAAVYFWEGSATMTNCSVQGNSGADTAIYFRNTTGTLINCTVQGNAVDNAILVRTTNVTLTNCLIWDNSPSGPTTNPEASLRIFSSGSATYTHCLVANINPAGTGNLDGTDPNNAPKFFLSKPPTDAPTTESNVRLFFDSPGVDAGDNSASAGTVDLDGTTRTVNGTIDIGAYETAAFTPVYVNQASNGANNGTSWSNAYEDLRVALLNGQIGDIFWVADGSYTPSTNDNDSFEVPAGTRLYGGFAGNESSLSQRNPTAFPTILTGELGSPSSPFDNTRTLVIANGDTLIDGVTIRDGRGSGIGSAIKCGGGADIDIIGCTFTKGQSGAVLVFQSTTVDFESCSFIENENVSLGGAVFNSNGSTCNFTNCRFLNNTADRGGAVSDTLSTSRFINCLFSGNEAEAGGAFNGDRGDYQFVNCTFTNNRTTAFNSRGGGVRVTLFTTGSLDLKNCLLWKNFVRGSGFTPTDNLPVSSLDVDNFTNTTFENNLIQNRSDTELGSSTNLDGADIDNTPVFVSDLGEDATAGTEDDDPSFLVGSPGIDNGDNSFIALTEDLSDQARILDGDINGTATVDLGAFETKPPILVQEGASGDGSTWANALPNPQDALAIAGEGDQIWVGAGTYTPGTARTDSFVLKNGVQLFGGFAGTEAAVSERDADPRVDTSWLSGEIGAVGITGNSYHVVVGTGTDSSAVFDGFVITGGKADNSTNRNHLGGGFICDGSGSPSIRNSILLKNQTDFVGGGMYLNAASPSFTNVAFLGNDAFEVLSPGGVSGEGAGAYLNNSNPTFTNCLFALNVADNDGGAISNHSSSPTFLNCTFARNSSFQTGGMIYNSSATSNPQLTNVVIWETSGSALSDIITLPNESSYQNTLIQFFTPSLANPGNNFDGNNPALDPNYADPDGDDNILRTLDDDFSIDFRSPIANRGNNSAVSEPIDFDRNPRIRNETVDLGAFEAEYVNFTELFPGLSRDGDENQNGISNFADYAEGYDPTAPDPLNRDIEAFVYREAAPEKLFYQFSVRTNAEDIDVTVQTSDNLEQFNDIITVNLFSITPNLPLRTTAEVFLGDEPFPDMLYVRRKYD
ncbi:MAG: right-handed parallel beta-helix repeat-containing protein, partial [Verrucomicrobiota bacterium]